MQVVSLRGLRRGVLTNLADALFTETEGEIITFGQAVGLGSAVNYKSLVDELDKVNPAKPLVIAFDADDSGRDNAAKLEAELQKRKVPYVMAPDFYGEYHDANDMLLKAPDQLRGSVQAAYASAEAVPDPKDEAKNEYLRTSTGRSLKAFMEAITGGCRPSQAEYRLQAD